MEETRTCVSIMSSFFFFILFMCSCFGKLLFLLQILGSWKKISWGFKWACTYSYRHPCHLIIVKKGITVTPTYGCGCQVAKINALNHLHWKWTTSEGKLPNLNTKSCGALMISLISTGWAKRNYIFCRCGLFKKYFFIYNLKIDTLLIRV